MKNDDLASAVGVSPDGSTVFVTGASLGPTGNFDYATLAYDAFTGATRWATRYDGAQNDDRATALGVSPDGATVFVTGTSVGATTSEDFATVAYDAATGAQLWAKRYNGPSGGADSAIGLKVSPDGSSVFVAGSTGRSRIGEFATVAYNASKGTMRWAERYAGPGNHGAAASALALSPDGSRVFVTGLSAESAGLGPVDYATVAYDASTGVQLWGRGYNGPGRNNDEATALGVSPDGSSVFVTGSSADSYGFSDYATVAYKASTGTQRWVKRYNPPGVEAEDTAYALEVSPGGSSVFVTGFSGATASGWYDYVTLAYDASTGALRWTTSYDGTGNRDDVATALAVTADSSIVVVTGFSAGSNSADDFATAAYGASSGTQLWTRRYNGPANGNDRPIALGISPDGSRVFVTGTSLGPNHGEDYATVAYRAA